jgi:hypothetical protein
VQRAVLQLVVFAEQKVAEEELERGMLFDKKGCKTKKPLRLKRPLEVVPPGIVIDSQVSGYYHFLEIAQG